MMYEFELTGEEYRTIVDALKHAENSAVHSDSQAAFNLARIEMMEQRENHNE